MIPVIDLLIKNYIEDGLEQLRREPDRVRAFFDYASDRTKEDIIKLLTQFKIKVLSGYPREETQMPCIVVQIGQEQEAPYGIGAGIDEGYPEFKEGKFNYLLWNEEGNSKYVLETMKMEAQIRAEIWSDNAVVTSLLYAVVKYALLNARHAMHMEGLELPQITGGDLEPAPDYFPFWVYRRAAILTFAYYTNYPVGDQKIGQEDTHFNIGTTIDDINIRIGGYREDDGEPNHEEAGD